MGTNIRLEWESTLNRRGRCVLIHSRSGGSEPIRRKALALRAEPATEKVQGVFQFGDSLAIQPGDLIQPEGHAGFWEVMAVVDRIVGGQYVCLETRVRKRVAAAAQA